MNTGIMNTGTYTAKNWILTSSSGTLSYLLDENTWDVIDSFRNFVAESNHTSVEDYLLEFFTLIL